MSANQRSPRLDDLRKEIQSAIQMNLSLGWLLRPHAYLAEWDGGIRCCCPMGAVALAAGMTLARWQLSDCDDGVLFIAQALSVSPAWVRAFVRAFDNHDCKDEDEAAAALLGHEFSGFYGGGGGGSGAATMKEATG